MRSRAWIPVVAAAGWLMLLTSPAQAISLQNLVLGVTPSFTTSSGLTFSNFDVEVTGRLSDDLDEYDVEVLPNGFRLTGPMATEDRLGDILLSYNVSASQIVSASLRMSATVSVAGTAASVAEDTFQTMDGQLVGSLFVAKTGGGAEDLTDIVVFGGAVTELHVIKDILVDAFAEPEVGSTASIALIEQLFAIPEPSTLILVGLGLVGLARLAGRERA